MGIGNQLRFPCIDEEGDLFAEGSIVRENQCRTVLGNPSFAFLCDGVPDCFFRGRIDCFIRKAALQIVDFPGFRADDLNRSFDIGWRV